MVSYKLVHFTVKWLKLHVNMTLWKSAIYFDVLIRFKLVIAEWTQCHPYNGIITPDLKIETFLYEMFNSVTDI